MQAEAVETAFNYLCDDNKNVIYTPNSEIILAASNDSEFTEILNSADLIIPDGIGVVYGSKILGQPLPERVAGFDLVCLLFEKMAKAGKSVFLFGAKPGVAEAAAEKLEFISASKIEKIEYEKTLPHPEEVLAMAKCYKDPSLWNDYCFNYYCSHECPIGQEYVPEVSFKELSQITLEMLASLNALEKEKNRLIEITVDGVISEDELNDFKKIQTQLSQISLAIDSLQLWVEKALIDGKIASHS